MARSKYISPVEKDLIKRSPGLNARLNKTNKKLDKILQSTIIAPERKAAYWNNVNREVDKIYKEMDVVYSTWVSDNLPKYYRKTTTITNDKTKKSAKAHNHEPKKPISKLKNDSYAKTVTGILVDDSINDFTTATAGGKKNIKRYLNGARKATNELFLEGEDITGANMIAKLKNTPGSAKALDTVLNTRYTQIIDKNNNPRNYRNTYYAEMVNRVKWHEAQSASAKQVAVNYNTDLIRVSAHNTTTEICQSYEGKVMSISGKTPGFPLADQVPPYHVNCLHFIVPVFIESLRATGTEQAFKDFGSGKTDKPPFPKTFVPVEDRKEAA